MKNETYPYYKEAVYVKNKGDKSFSLYESSPFWELERTLKVSPPFSPKYLRLGIALIVESPERIQKGMGTFSGLRNLTYANWYQGDLVRITNHRKGSGNRQNKDLLLAQIREDGDGNAVMRLVHIPKYFKYPNKLANWIPGFLDIVIAKRGRTD